ncbi:MAG: YigZ family protein [Denitrovibrio sp.]|nr:MAG: YigZ family protein [Denitrovibrio sp.]
MTGYTLTKPVSVKVDIKKSSFIAHLFPLEMFDDYMEKLRTEHPKARHFVWATRYINEHNQIVENCSDDGEPKNTSGKPTLKVLQGHDIVNAGIITVRYFGGVKLGTGGLVRAYNDAGQEAVELAKLISLDSLSKLTLTVAYNQTKHVEYHIDRLKLKSINTDFGVEDVTYTVQGESEKLDELNDAITKAP